MTALVDSRQTSRMQIPSMQAVDARPSGRRTAERRALDLSIAEQCRLNLLRLTANLVGGRVLSVEAPGLSMSAALAAYYEQVDEVGGIGGTAAAAQADASGPYAGATLYGRRPTAADLAWLRRRIGPGGWLLIGTDNVWWPQRRSNAPSAARARLCRQVQSAGFNEVRAYWVEPSLAVPRQLIPATRPAVARFEAWRMLEQPSGVLRRRFVAAGWHEVLYPALVVVATA